MLSDLLARARKRPLVLAAVAVVAAGGAWTTGWVAGHAQGRGGDVAMTGGELQKAKAPKPRPPAPADLQKDIEILAERYKEPVGVAIMDVESGWIAHVEGDALFPQQSVSKLWVALATLESVDRGETTLDRVVSMTAEDRSVFYQPLGRRIRDTRPVSVSIAELLRWAITESDNSANDKLMRELGGADAVTGLLSEKGLQNVRVGAYERDLQAQIAGMSWRPEYGVDWNFQHARERLPNQVRDDAMAAYLADPLDGASPVGIVQALAALHRGELLSPASTQVMIGLLNDCRTGSRRLKAGLPAGWRLGHKTGTGQDWRGYSVGINDVGLVTAPDGRVYAIAVMMRKTAKPVGNRQAFFQAASSTLATHWARTRNAAPVGQVVAEGQAATEPAL
ncbi:class A beta-lactamase [Phenylobacterium sp.]|uniref:class A beta-lactamase n=1 Tax=Phenylobacterium sp. TaxID=1871053 RepID=UPI002F95C1C3